MAFGRPAPLRDAGAVGGVPGGVVRGKKGNNGKPASGKDAPSKGKRFEKKFEKRFEYQNPETFSVLEVSILAFCSIMCKSFI